MPSTPPHTQAQALPQVTLEKARLEVSTVRVQMTLGFLLILTACLASYWSSLKIGFLADDFLHIDYAAKALAGSWSSLLNNFWGNWAASDIMRSYRPITSLSIFVDYLLYGTHAAGFHLTNIFLLFACCALVSLIVLEITGPGGNRLGAMPAVWAGLLFAVYPLHPESVSWIIGRVDLLCTAFYLAAIFFYLRFRTIKEPVYLGMSLGCFLLSLMSKEMAVTLPAVILLSEVLLAKGRASGPGTALWRRALYVLWFWLLLGLYAILRTMILGTVIGGYSGDFHLETFADRQSLEEIFFPLNTGQTVVPWIKPLLSLAYAGAVLSGLIRVILRKCSPRAFTFLLLCAPLMVLPTFQIWHIFANLAGGRLFFLSSAPLCMFIALAALPASDTLTRRSAGIVTALGAVLLLLIFAGWSAALAYNQQAWWQAGKQMGALRKQVIELACGVPDQSKILLLNLPQDYAGCGILTRPQYLALLAQPPFAPRDLSTRLLTVEPPVWGSHDYLWPGRLSRLCNSAQTSNCFIWHNDASRFVPWSVPEGRESYAFSYSCQAAKSLIFNPPADAGRVDSEHPYFEPHTDFLRIYPGGSGITIEFPGVNLNPLKATIAHADISLATADGCSQCLAARCKLVWGTDQQAVLRPWSAGRLCWLGRFRSWSLAGNIRRLGIQLAPGDYHADFRGLTIAPQTGLIPQLEAVDAKPANAPFLAYTAATGQSLRLHYEAPAGTASTTVFFSPPNNTFEADRESEMASAVREGMDMKQATELQLNGPTADFTVPQAVLDQPGIHQVRVCAADKFGLPIGLPSEPLTIIVP